MKCRRCGERESVGRFIELCLPCFDAFEAEVMAREAGPDGTVEITDREVEYLADEILVPGHRSRS